MNEDKSTELQKAMIRASRYCAEQERSAFDIQKKLIQWGVPEYLHDDVIKKLKDENFIDDCRFARTFVRSKFRNNQWGKIKIAYALRQKQISENIISESLKEIDEDTYKETLSTLIEKKAKTTKAATDNEKKQKIAQAMAAKGYESDLVYALVFRE